MQDLVQAVYWARKSADQGNSYGQCFLAGCYFWGQGVPQDYIQAIYWWRKAAKQGNPMAIKILSNIENN